MSTSQEERTVLEKEKSEIEQLYRLFLLEKAPALVGPNHESVELPGFIYDILLQVVGYLRQGKGVSIVPVMAELTTQQAANLLGVSRPFLVGLLHDRRIPFHKTGTHRRIYRKDVMDYRDRRDSDRKRVLDEIAKQAMAGGDYDTVPDPFEDE
jgi:excisionase family DNA binding protein